jgi:hypothetical protein
MPKRKLKDTVKADFRSVSAKQTERLESCVDGNVLGSKQFGIV